MTVKTKKYALPKGKYIRKGLGSTLKAQWWVIPIALAIGSLSLVYDTVWWAIIGVIAYFLYVLFWYIQFYGVTQLPQNQMMFDKMYYQINSQQIMMMMSPKQGMPIKWDQIKSATAGKDYFQLNMSRGQFFLLPFGIFNSQNDIKFTESILKRKGYLK